MNKMPHIQLDDSVNATAAILPGDPAEISPTPPSHRPSSGAILPVPASRKRENTKRKDACPPQVRITPWKTNTPLAVCATAWTKSCKQREN